MTPGNLGRAWEIHGLSLHTLGTQSAPPWPEVQQELAALLREARRALAWRADFDARVLGETAALRKLALSALECRRGRIRSSE